jgi:hypothetical protein
VLNPLLEDLYLALDPVAFSKKAGIVPDDWQARLLRSTSRRILLNCSRQSGKSTTAGTLADHTAIYQPNSTTILLAPGLRQSQELHRKVLAVYRALGKPVAPEAENKLSLELENGSRIICLPGSEATVRGISGVDLLIVEEASRVPQELIFAVRPMLATRPNARIIKMSTPFGTRGDYYETWRHIQQKRTNPATLGETWEYFEVPAELCPRISTEFLEEEKRTMGEWWFEQEYHCKFLDAQSSAFPRALIDQAFVDVEQWAL